MMAGLILAGGRGLRLGGVDKAYVRVGGEFLVARVARILAPQVGRLAISANGEAGRFGALGLAVLGDEGLVGKGPVAGVVKGLAWAALGGDEYLVTVPVDTVFVPGDLVARLGAGPAVAVWGGRQHHLVAVWPVAAVGVLRGFLAGAGPYRVRDALALVGARPVLFEEEEDPFLNVNTAEDLALAALRLATGG